uniref:KTSC domain-containing protein n=1 Tax=Candidatus Kentrum sp. DK TaxID=2126562 RepID=A0A450TF70_9GAMM|nr:MAG: KTSC domain-containing protein [Candidatus Kentron sp. DK]
MEMISVSSSAISAIGYDPTSRRMKIRFQRGSTYDFCSVPQSVFDEFISSSSKGRYYDSRIRGKYQCY